MAGVKGRSGGKRPGAGRPRSKPILVSVKCSLEEKPDPAEQVVAKPDQSKKLTPEKRKTELKSETVAAKPQEKQPSISCSAEEGKQSHRVFLENLVENDEVDLRLRVDAAKALLTADLRATAAIGKKEQRKEAAAKIGGKFAQSAPPRLVANNTK